MIDWVEEHLIEGFSIQDLGIFMGYSPYYCSFKFHQNTGITLKRYRLLRSMYLASQELKDYHLYLLLISLLNMVILLRKLLQELLKNFMV